MEYPRYFTWLSESGSRVIMINYPSKEFLEVIERFLDSLEIHDMNQVHVDESKSLVYKMYFVHPSLTDEAYELVLSLLEAKFSVFKVGSPL